MRLLAFPKDADSIVCTTTGTRAGSITLSGVSVCWDDHLFFVCTHTLDFFKRHRSHALHTLLRTLLSECESDVGVDWRAAMIYEVESMMERENIGDF
jgi:hypothetical protein